MCLKRTLHLFLALGLVFVAARTGKAEEAADVYVREPLVRRSAARSTSEAFAGLTIPRHLRSVQGKGIGTARSDSHGRDMELSLRDQTAGPHAVVMSDFGNAATTTLAGGSCRIPNRFDALASDRTFFVVADDFGAAAAGSISSIRWWGAYGRPGSSGFVDCQGNSPDAFAVRYFRNNAGVPGALLASLSQVQGSLSVSAPVATGAIVAEVVPEYESSATHAPVSVGAGECLWIEISNSLPTDCIWFWETSDQGNGWAMQDGDGISPPNGYTVADVSGTDLAFCMNLLLTDPSSCGPPRPPNDDCTGASSITGESTFPFDNTLATTGGTRIQDCYPSTDVLIEGDVWFCWTAPCTEPVLASTCGLTTRDTLIAVYDGCACPASSAALITCNDDRCGANPSSPLQSMAVFEAVAGQSYLLRVGTYPASDRGTGSLSLACGPPDNRACGGAGDCCSATGAPGCANEACCELVCACDSFCCDVEWDANCAGRGFQSSGCGAELLCPDQCAICGNPTAGGCCQANTGRGGCNDAHCCEAVCSCDSFCCDVEWDEGCAGNGFGGNGCGAAVLCAALCGPPDSDGDGVADPDDNCPNTANSNQIDCNNDGEGDACDPDVGQSDEDVDGICDESDRCPGFNDLMDMDIDGAPDGCDICQGSDDRLDMDTDGKPDGCDLCPVDNPDDSDGDDVCDSVDRCPGFDDRVDADADGTPNGCDRCPVDNPDDADSDGVCTSADRCPGQNDALDANQNGLPDCLEPQDIPALSFWGALVLALLLAVIHRIRFGVRASRHRNA